MKKKNIFDIFIKIPEEMVAFPNEHRKVSVPEDTFSVPEDTLFRVPEGNPREEDDMPRDLACFDMQVYRT